MNGLEVNLDENLILEKQVTKFIPKYRNFRYFVNLKISLVARNDWGSIENGSEDVVYNFLSPKFVFIFQNKNSRFNLEKHTPKLF